MKRKLLLKKLMPLSVAVIGLLSCCDAYSAFISLGRTNYFQNFDSLVSSGKSTLLPSGWAMTYGSDKDVSIFADNGSGTMGRIYSYGDNGSSERAFGSLRQTGMSPSQTVAFGANFQNTSGGAFNRLNISYTGEEWRLGAAGRGQDRLQFQYSLNASSLTSGTWINVPGLDFLTPNLVGVGAHNGNLAANQTAISGSIGFLNIAAGANFWVRWVDLALPGGGPEDGLGVDIFTISGVPEASTWCGALAAIGLLGGVLLKRRSLNFGLAC
jgi:hypothetical protein